jgi:membrane protein EpsK
MANTPTAGAGPSVPYPERFTAGTESSISAAPRVAPGRSERFALNLVSNVGKLGLTMVVGAWYVPFLVRQLGPAAYGLVPLASTITSYMALVTFGLEAAMSRSLAISLEQKDYRRANIIFNVVLWGNLGIAVLLAIPAVAAIANIENLVRIPAGYESATRWLFAGTVAAFLLNQVKTPFAAPCFCLNRLDLQNVVAVSETLVRVGLVVFLFFVFAPRIEYVGAAILAGTVVSILGAIWFWKVLTPNLHVRLRDFQWGALKSLCGTGGWVIVSQIGVMLYLNIDLVVANRLFGPGESGRYAAVLQLPALLRVGSIAVGEIFAPTMYQKYARGDRHELAAYLNNGIKFLGFVMALVIGLTCGFSKPLLQLWLGPAFGSLAPLLCLMVIHLCINLSMYPLYAVPLAANRVKVPGLVTLGIGLLNLSLALLLARGIGWGLYGIAAAGAISLTLRHLVFTPLYSAAVLRRPYRTFYRQVVPILVATMSTAGLCRLILLGRTILNWVQLATAALVVSLAFTAAVYLLLGAEERATLKAIIVRWKK